MSYCGTKPNYIFSVKWRRLILLSILSCACIVIVVFTLPLAEDLNIRRYIVWNGNTDTFNLSNAEDQGTRLLRLREYCSTHPVLWSSELRNGSYFPQPNCSLEMLNYRTGCPLKRCPMFLVKQKGIAFCMVPKTGSRTIRQELVNVANLTQSDVYKDFNVSGAASVCLDRFGLDYYTPEEMEGLLKVIFVRHPFTRLISAYTDKIVLSEYPSGRFIPFLKKHGMLRQNYNTTGLTFKEFVQMVVLTPVNDLRYHWKPISRLCDPCHMHYDFIGKLETFKNDVRLLTDRIQISPEKTHSTTKKDQYKALFEQLSLEDVNSLERVYRDDFAMFGYTVEEFLQMYEIVLK